MRILSAVLADPDQTRQAGSRSLTTFSGFTGLARPFTVRNPSSSKWKNGADQLSKSAREEATMKELGWA
jgi:hypothetical protein